MKGVGRWFSRNIRSAISISDFYHKKPLTVAITVARDCSTLHYVNLRGYRYSMLPVGWQISQCYCTAFSMLMTLALLRGKGVNSRNLSYINR